MGSLDWLTNFKFNQDWGWLANFSGTIWIIGITAILFGLAVFAWFILQYKYEVWIFERKGGGYIRVARDKARKILEKDSKVVRYKLLHGKEIFPAPEKQTQVFVCGKRDIMYLELIGNSFHPIDLVELSEEDKKVLKFRSAPQSVLAWHAQTVRKGLTEYAPKKRLEMYAPIILGSASFILVFIMFLIIINQIKNGISVEVTGNIQPIVTLPTMTNPGMG